MEEFNSFNSIDRIKIDLYSFIPMFALYQVISNDRYKSILHRAVVNSNKERISVPTFYCPSPDAVIGPAKELISDEQPAVYRDFTYAEYYEKFWNRGLATECCLDMFKASTA